MTARFTSPDLNRVPVVLAGRTSPAQFRDLMACWPSGVAVVTSTAAGKPVGCTVTALASISTDPPLLLVSLATSSRTLMAILERNRFGISVLSTDQGELARRFAGGDAATRFAGVSYVWVMGVPVLRAAVLGAVCEVRTRLTVADHVLVIASPLWQAHDLTRAPAIWYQRDYWRLLPSAGDSTGVDPARR
jgi:flavin reductase (DIM6/NTAB) family NADH-FMN oxidoreductase RutF